MAKQKAARINTATHNPKRKGPSDQQEGLFLNKKAKNICWKCVLHESEKIGHEALRGQYESGTLDPKFYHKFHQAQNETERKSRDLLKNRWIKSKIHKKMTESTGLKEPDESCNDETLAKKCSHEFSRIEDKFGQLLLRLSQTEQLEVSEKTKGELLRQAARVQALLPTILGKSRKKKRGSIVDIYEARLDFSHKVSRDSQIRMAEDIKAEADILQHTLQPEESTAQVENDNITFGMSLLVITN
eukprot:m.233761 g.233761  ORF g.233761 m.233761 type:complete len:244 (+) comp16029_c0_seq8:83-814(+)